jgi:hypothetical protein
MMDVEIVLSRTADPNCHRCGRGLLLSVQIPATMSTPEGDATDRRTVELCHRCDRDDPGAQGVLAYFTVHERIEKATVGTGGLLVREGIDYITANPPAYTDAGLDDDIRSWEAGNM